jgi:hypothetical protein
MRLWSLHPSYLDKIGLIALWRESLLAKKVIEGNTKGYIHHPQLTRFRNSKDPVSSINFYLSEIFSEARARGFDFDKSKIGKFKNVQKIIITDGQLNYEFNHLKKKLSLRDINKFKEIKNITDPETHPIFDIIKGDVEPWEKINN